MVEVLYVIYMPERFLTHILSHSTLSLHTLLSSLIAPRHPHTHPPPPHTHNYMYRVKTCTLSVDVYTYITISFLSSSLFLSISPSLPHSLPPFSLPLYPSLPHSLPPFSLPLYLSLPPSPLLPPSLLSLFLSISHSLPPPSSLPPSLPPLPPQLVLRPYQTCRCRKEAPSSGQSDRNLPHPRE